MALSSARTRPDDQLDGRLEEHRSALTGYCYRMLGSGFEAEDAVQESFVRAWRRIDQLDSDAALKSWLYRIATNVCLDMLRTPQRRAMPMEIGMPSSSAGPLGDALPENVWVLPVPDQRVLGDPAAVTAERATIRLAFVAALQHLPPRQRAVLILREVLHWQAAEVAALLETSVASVNSALQRARATLDALDLDSEDASDESTEEELVQRYLEAFERYDMDALVSLLHEDVVFDMPPYPLWMRGPDNVRGWMLGHGIGCRGSRVVPVRANGRPAIANYRDGGKDPFAIIVLEVRGDRIAGVHNFLGPELFEHFGLPPTLS